jgi:hypothetical protein
MISQAIIVIITNLIISVINFYLAWKVWQIRSSMLKITQKLTLLEKNLQYTLVYAPLVISQGKNKTELMSLNYRRLQKLLDTIGKIWLLWQLSSRTWPRKR